MKKELKILKKRHDELLKLEKMWLKKKDKVPPAAAFFEEVARVIKRKKVLETPP